MASQRHLACASVGWKVCGARYGRHDRAVQHAHSVWAASAKQQEARHPSSILYQAKWQAVCTSRHGLLLCCLNLCCFASLHSTEPASIQVLHDRHSPLCDWLLILVMVLLIASMMQEALSASSDHQGCPSHMSGGFFQQRAWQSPSHMQDKERSRQCSCCNCRNLCFSIVYK